MLDPTNEVATYSKQRETLDLQAEETLKRTTRPQKESRASAATCIVSRAQHFALVAPKSADVRYSVSWDETTKIPHFRRASYNLIFSSSQIEISFGFGFFDSLTHCSGQIVSGRVVFGL